MTLGQALREETASRGWNQREAAEHIGVSQQAYSRWLKGGRVDPYYLPDLARFLKLKRDEVARLALAPPPDPDEARLRRIEREMAGLRKAVEIQQALLQELVGLLRGA